MACRKDPIHNQGILLLAALAAIQVAQGLENSQVETLGMFFTVLGDNLTLLASPPCWGERQTEQEDAVV